MEGRCALHKLILCNKIIITIIITKQLNFSFLPSTESLIGEFFFHLEENSVPLSFWSFLDKLKKSYYFYISSSLQSLSRVQLFVAPWAAALQVSLSITNSQSMLKLMCLTRWCHPTLSSSVILFSCLQSFPESESFPMSQFFASGGQSIGASASSSVLPMTSQDWFPLGLTGFISLKSKRL